MTIREMINNLEALAKTYGDNTPCTIYDEYTAAEGWGYEEKDLYIPAEPTYNDKMKVVVIG